MRVIFDVETYYDDKYSLKKMHTLEYVRDERFKLHGMAVKVDDRDTEYLYAEDVPAFLESLPADVEMIGQNTYFDGLVLYHHYNFVPGRYGDTMSMSRALFPHQSSHSLEAIGEFLSLGSKIEGTLADTKGIRDLPPELHERLAVYAKQDVDLTAAIYDKLAPALPEDELELIHLTLVWGCRPVLQVDLPRAKAALEQAITEREAKIEASGYPLATLSSQPKFTAVLEELGVDVPLKENDKGDMIPALSKSDLGFHEMRAEYPEHSAVFEGRLAAKSTIDVTRIKRVIDIGSSGTLPMPLKYSGAHTHRWSGADGLNPQNFRRGSELRKSIIAPPGYVILVSDLKQIEPRTNMWFCDEQEWLEVFRQGIDIYTATAASTLDIPLEDITPQQRFFGKTLELGLGYQMGWKKFRTQCALRGIYLSEAEAYRIVSSYRAKHPNNTRMWDTLRDQLPGMYRETWSHELGPIEFIHEGIILPNGMRLDYSNLTPHENNNWTYGYHPKYKYIYGGKMLENIIQALARIVIGEQLLELHRQGFETVSTTHDEILFLVREAEADAAEREVRRVMSTPPTWAPDLPLDVDSGYAREYSK